MIFSQKTLKQILSFFALVRVQNILLISIAIVITAKYIFVPKESFFELLTNINFLLLIFATTISIASGYIINSFYDVKKDLINRPKKTVLEQELSQKIKLRIYFTLNFLAVFIAWFISYRSALFFSVFIFLIWLYSHKIHATTFMGNLSASFLSIYPFFGVFLFFKKFNSFIFLHAVFLFLLLLIKDMIKNFVNLKGDIVAQNQTIPVKYGEKKAKYLILVASLLQLIPMYLLIKNPTIGNMKYYFYLFLLMFYTGLTFFLISKKQKNYNNFYFLLKILIALGVFSVIFVKR